MFFVFGEEIKEEARRIGFTALDLASAELLLDLCTLFALLSVVLSDDLTGFVLETAASDLNFGDFDDVPFLQLLAASTISMESWGFGAGEATSDALGCFSLAVTVVCGVVMGEVASTRCVVHGTSSSSFSGTSS